jgi:osmotically-inducible protein OsmY
MTKQQLTGNGRSTERLVTDQQIQRAIISRFDWSRDIDSARIGVAVTDGAVTLSGEAASRSEKDAAVQAATRVRGISAVVDDIVVGDVGCPINDADIARNMQSMLRHHDELKEAPIVATVHEHVVTLTGIVDEAEQCETACRAAAVLPGVGSVIDRLAVRPSPTVEQLADAITGALVCGVESEVAHLRIGVDGCVATLEGNLRSWYERRVVERAVRAVPGITDVHNQLVVTF